MIEKKHQLVEGKLKDYINALTSPEGNISDNSTLDNMTIDSIALVKILVFIEKQFNISLINAGLAKDDIETFGSLVKHICKQI